MLVQSLSNEFCTVINIIYQGFSFYHANFYFKPLHEREQHLLNLTRVMEKFANQPLIMVGDFNAHSSLWYNEKTDQTGEKIELLIAKHSIYIENFPGQPATFSTPYGESNIDLTLSNLSGFYIKN